MRKSKSPSKKKRSVRNKSKNIAGLFKKYKKHKLNKHKSACLNWKKVTFALKLGSKKIMHKLSKKSKSVTSKSKSKRKSLKKLEKDKRKKLNKIRKI